MSECDLNFFILPPAYTSALMESLRVEYSRSPQALPEHSTDLSSSAPAPLCRSLQRINKDEAVGVYLAQHSRFNTKRLCPHRGLHTQSTHTVLLSIYFLMYLAHLQKSCNVVLYRMCLISTLFMNIIYEIYVC